MSQFPSSSFEWTSITNKEYQEQNDSRLSDLFENVAARCTYPSLALVAIIETVVSAVATVFVSASLLFPCCGWGSRKACAFNLMKRTALSALTMSLDALGFFSPWLTSKCVEKITHRFFSVKTVVETKQSSPIQTSQPESKEKSENSNPSQKENSLSDKEKSESDSSSSSDEGSASNKEKSESASDKSVDEEGDSSSSSGWSDYISEEKPNPLTRLSQSKSDGEATMLSASSSSSVRGPALRRSNSCNKFLDDRDNPLDGPLRSNTPDRWNAIQAKRTVRKKVEKKLDPLEKQLLQKCDDTVSEWSTSFNLPLNTVLELKSYMLKSVNQNISESGIDSYERVIANFDTLAEMFFTELNNAQLKAKEVTLREWINHGLPDVIRQAAAKGWREVYGEHVSMDAEELIGQTIEKNRKKGCSIDVSLSQRAFENELNDRFTSTKSVMEMSFQKAFWKNRYQSERDDLLLTSHGYLYTMVASTLNLNSLLGLKDNTISTEQYKQACAFLNNLPTLVELYDSTPERLVSQLPGDSASKEWIAVTTKEIFVSCVKENACQFVNEKNLTVPKAKIDEACTTYLASINEQNETKRTEILKKYNEWLVSIFEEKDTSSLISPQLIRFDIESPVSTFFQPNQFAATLDKILKNNTTERCKTELLKEYAANSQT